MACALRAESVAGMDRRVAPVDTDAKSLDRRLCQAISRALSEARTQGGLSRDQVARRMGEILGESCSAPMLNAYSATSHPQHNISLKRFVGLVHATQATWLIDVLAQEFGGHFLAPPEFAAAEAARLESEIATLQREREAVLRSLRPPLKSTGSPRP